MNTKTKARLNLAAALTGAPGLCLGQTQPGALLGKFDAGSPIRSSPAVAQDGTVYFGAGGTLYAVTNLESNQWTFATGNPSDSSPAVAADGMVYYSSMTPSVPSSGYLYSIR